MTPSEFREDVWCWWKQNDWATVWWKNHDDVLSHFHLIPERYRQTDRQTDLLYQYRASVCWCAIKTEIFFFNFRIVVGSLPHNPRNLGIKISHSCREIAFCPVGYFNLSHPVEWLDYRVVKKLWQYVKPFSYNTVHNATDRPRDRQTDRIATLMLCISTLTCNKMHNFHTVSVQNTHYAS